jgi:hypothetical protein
LVDYLKILIKRLTSGSGLEMGGFAGGVNSLKADRRWLIVLILATLWILYVIARVLLIPANGAVVKGFTHDSGYISIVAERVRDGEGFTNPAHWLLFLNPARLPMPFHNSNPGYPALNAALSGLLGVDVVYAGLLVSALSSAFLAAAVFALVQRFSGDLRFSALCSITVALFPPIWRLSYSLFPDSLFAALSISVIAVATRSRSPWGWFVSGVLFGLSWLVRSTSLLILLGLLWWVFRTRPQKDVIAAVLVFAIGAILVASPWLVHTQQTWGSPFRSDAAYYWLQDYYSYPHGGDVSKFWRSLTPPPSLRQILSSDAEGFLLRTLSGVPSMIYLLAVGLSEASRPAAIVLFALLAFATVHSFRLWRRSEFQAGFLIVAVTAISLLTRARSLEIRYFIVAIVFLILWVLLPLREFFLAKAGSSHWGLRMAIASGCALYTLVFLVPQDRNIFREMTRTSPELASYQAVVWEVAREFPNEQAIITDRPYICTYYTKVPALSPPNASKTELLRFMSQYSARLLLLPTDAIEYYYPEFQETLPPEIQVVKQLGHYTLLRRTTSP